MLQNDDGHYSSAAHTLKFEGSMFMYNPQRGIAQWVLVRGVLASLTMVGLRSANDLNNMIPSPYEETEPVPPPSPALVKGIPAGVESDTDSFDEDSGEEWDKKECGNWSHCPSPPLRVGPTWAEVHAVAQEQEALDRRTSTWEEIVRKHGPKGTEEDSDWDKEKQEPAESQFKDATLVADVEMEDPVEESVAEAPPAQHFSEASASPESQDMVQIHAGDDDLE